MALQSRGRQGLNMSATIVGGCIEAGEQYYQLSLEHWDYGYYPKCICEQCWRGKELEA
jgi:hypothetical protein